MTIDSNDFAYGVIGVRKVIDVGVSHRARRDIYRDDAQVHAIRPAILNQRALHDTDESFSIGRDGHPFHSLICQAALSIAGDFGVASRTQILDAEVIGKSEGPDALSRRAVELINGRTIFIWNEDAFAVVRNADRFRIKARIRGI